MDRFKVPHPSSECSPPGHGSEISGTYRETKPLVEVLAQRCWLQCQHVDTSGDEQPPLTLISLEPQVTSNLPTHFRTRTVPDETRPTLSSGNEQKPGMNTLRLWGRACLSAWDQFVTLARTSTVAEVTRTSARREDAMSSCEPEISGRGRQCDPRGFKSLLPSH
jgi:hypothetical protein